MGEKRENSSNSESIGSADSVRVKKSRWVTLGDLILRLGWSQQGAHAIDKSLTGACPGILKTDVDNTQLI